LTLRPARGINTNVNKDILDVAGGGEVEQNNPIDKAVAFLCPYSPQKGDGSEMHYAIPITNLPPKGSHSDCQSIIRYLGNSMILRAVSILMQKSIITLDLKVSGILVLRKISQILPDNRPTIIKVGNTLAQPVLQLLYSGTCKLVHNDVGYVDAWAKIEGLEKTEQREPHATPRSH
jgi:hypothetical protein